MDPVSVAALSLLPVLALAYGWVRRRRTGARGDAADSRLQQRHEVIDTLAGWAPETMLLLTNTERQAMALLKKALPDHNILAQVALTRFIRVPARNSYTEWLRRVGQHAVDLLVCDLDSQVIAVVEVRKPAGRDDERTRKRHLRTDRVLREAGIRVVVWDEAALPHVSAVRAQILGNGATPGGTVATVPAQPAQPAQFASAAAAPVRSTPEMASLDFINTSFNADEIIEMREPPLSIFFDEATRPVPAPASTSKKRR